MKIGLVNLTTVAVAATGIGSMITDGDVPRRWQSRCGGADAVEACPVVVRVDRVSNVQI